jgi:hypoxanthine phosphoribosyltransferase
MDSFNVDSFNFEPEQSIEKDFADNVFLSWKEVTYLVSELADDIMEKVRKAKKIGGYTHVTGISRGGLIPAVLLSHRLSIPYISFIEAFSMPGGKILCVDDICDTGCTMKACEKMIKHVIFKFHFASLCYRKNPKFKPMYPGKLVAHKEWIVFPWELPKYDKGGLFTIQDLVENKFKGR